MSVHIPEAKPFILISGVFVVSCKSFKSLRSSLPLRMTECMTLLGRYMTAVAHIGLSAVIAGCTSMFCQPTAAITAPTTNSDNALIQFFISHIPSKVQFTVRRTQGLVHRICSIHGKIKSVHLRNKTFARLYGLFLS